MKSWIVLAALIVVALAVIWALSPIVPSGASWIVPVAYAAVVVGSGLAARYVHMNRKRGR